MDKMLNIVDRFCDAHGDKYDYSRVQYKNLKSKVIIVCPTHGEFKQMPKNHLNGAGCMKCCYENMRRQFTISVEKRIEQFNKIHHNQYDYSLFTDICNKDQKISIICSDHGKFRQTIGSHLQGHGCPECSRIKEPIFTQNEFIVKARRVHGDKYDYSKVQYKNNKSKIVIVCPAHGEFEQIPNSHLLGKGCIRCPVIISDAHQEIVDLLCDYDVMVNDRSVIHPFELDIYIPEKRVAIEYHGNYWHSYNYIESAIERNKHKHKHVLCRERGIDLIQVFEYDWMLNKDIIKSMIDYKLGKSHRLFARCCDVVELDNKAVYDFFDNNHLYGHKNASVVLGLVFGGVIYAVMSFDRHKKFGWEINRFANRLDWSVVGGASRLFKYFVRKFDPGNVLTFADARFGCGLLYERLGFHLMDHTGPNYKYLRGDMVFSRHGFQKHKLEGKLDVFDKGLIEAENMFVNGYRRLWDAGHYKFVWRLDNAR